MSKIRVGSLVRLNFTEDNHEYFKAQGFYTRPSVTKDDIFEVKYIRPRTIESSELIEIERIADKRTFKVYSYRVTSIVTEYDPDQEPEDDCL